MARSVAAMALLAFLGTAPLALAQTGRVAGDVVDETGGALPGATVTLSGPGLSRVVQTDGAGAFVLDRLETGTYSVAISLAGFSPEAREVAISEDPVDLGSITLRLAGFGDTVVVTASRSEVRLVDAPVTTSVISSDTLEASPATNYGDVLRTVPGVNVVQLSARDVNVTSRQATGGGGQLAARPDGRTKRLPRLLRPGALGPPPHQHRRHRSDRGRAGAGVGDVGRQRHDRRGQHSHEVAAGIGRHDGDLHRRRDRSGRGGRPRGGARGRSSGPTRRSRARRRTGWPTASAPATSRRTPSRARPAASP